MLLNERYCRIQIPNLLEINDLSWEKLIIFAADDHQIKTHHLLYDYMKTWFLLWEHLQRRSLCGLQEYFSHPSLAIYLPSNPVHNTKIGTANRWETINSKPPQSETVVTLFSGKYWALIMSLYQLQQRVQKCSAKTILLSQTSMFWLFFIQF
jgi:hypothetical protein